MKMSQRAFKGPTQDMPALRASCDDRSFLKSPVVPFFPLFWFRVPLQSTQPKKGVPFLLILGGCQHYDPFWGCRIIIGIQKGTIILTTTHMETGLPRLQHLHQRLHQECAVAEGSSAVAWLAFGVLGFRV